MSAVSTTGATAPDGTDRSRILTAGLVAVGGSLAANLILRLILGPLLNLDPAFLPFEAYRRSHFAHHKEEFGPNEPDIPLYRGYAITRASMRRKLWRDARGSTGWKLLKPLFGALRTEGGRPVALRILACQAVLLALATAAGRPELYLGLWLVPFLTSWRVINRLRSIAEHGGMQASPDRRRSGGDRGGSLARG